jgi:hypothetical protein
MGVKFKKVLSNILVSAFLFTSLCSTFNLKAEAMTGVLVVVNGDRANMYSKASSQLNGLEALKEVTGGTVTVADSSYGGKELTGISGLNKNKYGISDGWNYVIYRDGNYIIPMTSIDQTELQSGDEFIAYYGAYGVTQLPNAVKLSTYIPKTAMTITINNYNSWDKTTTAINGATLKIDGTPVPVSGNTAALPAGLSEGTHTINISGYNTTTVPTAAEVTYTVNIAYPKINVELYGLNGKLSEGQVTLSTSAKTSLDVMKSFLDSNGTHYTVTNSWGEYLSEIDGITSGSLSSPNYDGWQYYIKKSDKIISPQVGMADYNMSQDETLVMYYGDTLTKYLYSIKFSPEIVKPNVSFAAQFIAQNGVPIQNSEVKIDGKAYTTDNYGKISVSPLGSGSHTYSLSFKKDSTIPEIIGTEGSFVIDGVNSPNFNYTSISSAKLEDRDNSGIKADIASEIKAVSSYINANGNDPYSAMSMKALGLSGNNSFLKEYKDDMEKYGAGDYANTDLEKLILGLKALEYSPYSFAGCDLVKTLLDRDINSFQINDLIFALNVYNYVKPTAEYKITKNILISKIIENKVSYTDKNYNNMFGFTLGFDKNNPSIDPDITAMAVSALAPYYNQTMVKIAIDSSINSLKLLENSSGYVIGKYGVSAETQSAVIAALTAVGIDPRGEDFSKVKGDLVTALLSFKGTDGQYKHSLDGTNNFIASEQVLRALISYSNFIKNGSYNYYVGTDAMALSEYKDLPKTGEPIDLFFMMTGGIIVLLIGFVLIKKEIA